MLMLPRPGHRGTLPRTPSGVWRKIINFFLQIPLPWQRWVAVVGRVEDDRFSEQQTAAPVWVSQLWQWRGPGSISSWSLAADAVARLVIQ